jgi:hypothetical protein
MGVFGIMGFECSHRDSRSVHELEMEEIDVFFCNDSDFNC